jgi:serine/threonine protein kinase
LASVAYSVLLGLSSVHQSKQIHRDIKPSNILLDRDGRIKISDFGIARKLEHSISMASTFTGTLTYMSPER